MLPLVLLYNMKINTCMQKSPAVSKLLWRGVDLCIYLLSHLPLPIASQMTHLAFFHAKKSGQG